MQNGKYENEKKIIVDLESSESKITCLSITPPFKNGMTVSSPQFAGVKIRSPTTIVFGLYSVFLCLKVIR